MRPILPVLLVSFVLPLMAAACSDAPADGCGDLDACDSTCGESGCSASTSGPSTTTSLGTTSADTSGAASSSSEVGTSTSDTTSSGCAGDAECGAATPHCSMGTCVACSATPNPDAACARLDPDFPLCNDDECVQCSDRDTTVCTGTVPVCDPTSHLCVGCTAHLQCPDSACHLDEGSCLPEDRVWYVDGDANNCLAASGTMAAPYCTIDDALGEIAQASRATIRVIAASAPYSEALAIDGNRTVALMGQGPTAPILDALGAPSVTVESATLFAERLRWQSNAQDPAIMLDDAVAWIDRSEIVQNQGGGIDASNGAMLHLRSSVIGAGGTGLADRVALRIDGATMDVVASTIAGNDGSATSSIRCLGGGGGSVRSSIVVGLDPPSISCLGLQVDDSAVDTNGLDGAGNMVFASFNAGWFVAPAAGDFHLVAGTVFEGLGLWHVGDPTVDLDGDARPNPRMGRGVGRDGVADVCGADVP